MVDVGEKRIIIIAGPLVIYSEGKIKKLIKIKPKASPRAA